MATTKKDVQKAASLLAEGKTQRDVAKEVGMNQSNLSRYLKGNVGGFRDALIEEMDKKGIGPKKIAEVLADGLDSMTKDKFGDDMKDPSTRLKYVKYVHDDILDQKIRKEQHDPSKDFGFVLNVIGNVSITAGPGGTPGNPGNLRGLPDLRGTVSEDSPGRSGGGPDPVDTDYESVEGLEDSGGAVGQDGEDPDYPA